MRKVLLATTALVAMSASQVRHAQAAESINQLAAIRAAYYGLKIIQQYGDSDGMAFMKMETSPSQLQ